MLFEDYFELFLDYSDTKLNKKQTNTHNRSNLAARGCCAPSESVTDCGDNCLSCFTLSLGSPWDRGGARSEAPGQSRCPSVPPTRRSFPAARTSSILPVDFGTKSVGAENSMSFNINNVWILHYKVLISDQIYSDIFLFLASIKVDWY